MKKIVECVPNFSEGRDKKKIDLIVAEAKKVKGVKVLGVDIDSDYNRTVLTFAGEPQAVKDAAFRVIAKSSELIDMSLHKGEHPRMGACDVCPFVPIQDANMADCVKLARDLGKEVGETLNMPVYLYEEAATCPERKNLAKVREGEYEGLEEKLRDPQWKPDYGEARFNKKAGAVMIGVRKPLIAYNVNLKTKNKEIADKIARKIRESSGGLKAVKAMGVFLKDYGICQVSMNLTNYKVTSIHTVFEAVKAMAPETAKVSGSEIVGLLPKEAILLTGKFYAPGEKSEKKLIKAAITNLGLNSLKKFNLKKKIIEYLITNRSLRSL